MLGVKSEDSGPIKHELGDAPTLPVMRKAPAKRPQYIKRELFMSQNSTICEPPQQEETETQNGPNPTRRPEG